MVPSLSMLNLFVWLRAISYLRVFKATRIFIFLLSKVVTSLGSFFIVTLCFLLTFTTCYLTITMDSENFFLKIASAFKI